MSPKTAFLFPGLGSESLQRFSELFALGPSFQGVVEQANGVILERLGVSIFSLIEQQARTAVRSAPTGRLVRPAPSQAILPTPIAHALLFTLECALAKVWIEFGVKPDFVAGYSLGEYSAAYVAGVIGIEDGVSLLISRAEILDKLPRTGMIAVAASKDEVASCIPEELYLVAANSVIQTVYGGREADLARAREALREHGHVFQDLPVRHAFHTPLMEGASLALDSISKAVPIQAPEVQFISTLTGTSLGIEELRHGTHWTRHLCEPVQFCGALDELRRLGAEVFLEIGPGQALSPLAESHFAAHPPALTAASLPSEYDQRSTAEHLSRTIERLRHAGLPIADRLPEALSGSFGVQRVSPVPSSINANTEVLPEILSIWAEILQHGDIGPDDNFFDLGGNSLKCAKIVMRIKHGLNFDLSLREIFSAPTPRSLCELILEGRRLQNRNSGLLALPNGLKIRCQSVAEANYFYKSIFEDRSYLQHGVTIRPGMTIFDVGANIGLFSAFAALEAPGVKLYSFEPVPPLFEILKYNVNDICEDAELFNVGVSDSEGSSTITYYPNSPGMSSFMPSRGEEQAVLEAILKNSFAEGDQLAGDVLKDQDDYMESRFQTEDFLCKLIPLNHVFKQHDIKVLDLLKVDVQKLEMRVLKGISDSYWPLIRQVVVEVHDHQNRVTEVADFLSSRDFSVVVEQDHLYQGSDIYMVYGLHSSLTSSTE